MKQDEQKHPFHFGAWLKREILSQRFSILAFAKRCHIDNSSFHRWFKDAVPDIRNDKLAAIAAGLGYPMERLENLLVEAMKTDPKTQALWKEVNDRVKAAAARDPIEEIMEWDKMEKEGLVEDEREKLLISWGLEGLDDIIKWFTYLNSRDRATALGKIREALTRQAEAEAAQRRKQIEDEMVVELQAKHPTG
jgi:transcriptional regulator with XRE-family HTH domain